MTSAMRWFACFWTMDCDVHWGMPHEHDFSASFVSTGFENDWRQRSSRKTQAELPVAHETSAFVAALSAPHPHLVVLPPLSKSPGSLDGTSCSRSAPFCPPNPHGPRADRRMSRQDCLHRVLRVGAEQPTTQPCPAR